MTKGKLRIEFQEMRNEGLSNLNTEAEGEKYI